jgi:hypothetical protein
VQAIALVDSLLYIGLGDKYEFRAYDRRGKLVRIVRRLVTPQPIPPAAITEWKRQNERHSTGVPSDLLAEHRKRLVFPQYLPMHGQIIGDKFGNLWVEEYRTFPDSAGTDWTVFDARGRMRAVAHLRGHVEGRTPFRITELGPNFVTGVVADSDGVEQAAVYRIRVSK